MRIKIRIAFSSIYTQVEQNHTNRTRVIQLLKVETHNNHPVQSERSMKQF